MKNMAKSNIYVGTYFDELNNYIRWKIMELPRHLTYGNDKRLENWDRDVSERWKKLFDRLSENDARNASSFAKKILFSMIYCWIFTKSRKYNKGNPNLISIVEKIRRYEDIEVDEFDRSGIFNEEEYFCAGSDFSDIDDAFYFASLIEFINSSMSRLCYLCSEEERFDRHGVIFTGSRSPSDAIFIPGIADGKQNGSVLFDFVCALETIQDKMISYFYSFYMAPEFCRSPNEFADWIRICKSIIEKACAGGVDIADILKTLSILRDKTESCYWQPLNANINTHLQQKFGGLDDESIGKIFPQSMVGFVREELKAVARRTALMQVFLK